jgi:hypothetical protein
MHIHWVFCHKHGGLPNVCVWWLRITSWLWRSLPMKRLGEEPVLHRCVLRKTSVSKDMDRLRVACTLCMRILYLSLRRVLVMVTLDSVPSVACL